MLMTTRNPAEALAFVNSLSLDEHEKAEIVMHFKTITKLMEEMKSSKSLNSKGGEKWFVGRLTEKVSQAQATVSSLLRGMEGEDLARALFIASQNSASKAVIEIATECEASPELIADLEQYCELLNGLAKKYTGFDRNEFDVVE